MWYFGCQKVSLSQLCISVAEYLIEFVQQYSSLKQKKIETKIYI